jgi:hypothetical protein
MAVAHKSQKAGGSCGATNNKMKGGSVKKSQNGGGSCGASNKKSQMGGNKHEKKMMGGNKHENKMKGGSKKTKKSGKLAADEAICFNCRKAGKNYHVKMVDAKDVTKKTTKRTMKGKSGKCAVCGGKVFKIVGGGK